MRNAGLSRFTADEQGGGTIMGLFWFMVLVAAAGLAVDTTDGLRNKTMLQATADSAALAAAIDLPDETQVTDTAVAYATGNMGTGLYGSVLAVDDVETGMWDHATRTFYPDAPLPDAVQVVLRRATENDNAVPINFLRIIGIETWDVRVRAMAQRYTPDCLRDGLIARNKVWISSNNDFVNNICVHGKKGVHISSNNYFETGVSVSMYDLNTLVIPDSGLDSNIGLEDALRESGLDPRMVDHVDAIMQDLLDRDPAVLPAYIDPDLPVLDVKPGFDFGTAEPGRIYHVLCQPDETVEMPAKSLIQEIVIVSECLVTFHAKVTMVDVVLASRNGGNGDITATNIEVNAQVQFGAQDDCTPGGGVQMFSNASMHFNAKTTFDGVQMVAAGNIELNAQEEGINGIAAQAGIDIPLTSENVFGLCSGGAPELFTAAYYRLVR